ncbi:MAG: hypothetical protein IT428_05800 [Planctomycetaceae bacterium]|nr:hypothetical protein [Planctomycetaceae bacterium]
MSSVNRQAGTSPQTDTSGTEWLREAMLQMRWTLRVRRYVEYLKKLWPDASVERFGLVLDWVERKVLGPLRTIEWIPGLTSHLLKVDPTEVRITRWTESTAQLLRERLCEVREAEVIPRRADFARWIVECIDEARSSARALSDEAEPGDLGPELPCRQMLSNWVQMARSVAAWQELAPELEQLDRHLQARTLKDLDAAIKALDAIRLPDHDSKVRPALGHALDGLRACRERLEPSSGHDVPPGDLHKLNTARNAIEGVLSDESTPHLVPSLLARFRSVLANSGLPHLAEECFESLVAKYDVSVAEVSLARLRDRFRDGHESARAALVLLLVAFVDARNGAFIALKDGIDLYDAVLSLAEELNLSLPPSIQGRGWNEGSWWLSFVEQDESGDPEQKQQILATGVYFECDGEPVLCRNPKRRVPRPQAAVAADLRLLRSHHLQLSGNNLRDVEWIDTIIEILEPFNQIEAWWETIGKRNPDHRRALWNLLVRCAGLAEHAKSSDARGDAARLILHQFEEAEFRLVPVTAEEADTTPWCFLSAEPNEGLSAPDSGGVTGAGVALLVPGESEALASAAWIRIPRRWRLEDKLLDTLCAQAGEISFLHRKNPEWKGWLDFRDDVWAYVLELRHAHFERQDGKSAHSCRKEFVRGLVVRTLECRRSGRRDLERAFHLLARTALAHTPSAASLFPFQLDAETLRPLLPLPPDQIDYEVEIAAEDVPVGLVDFELGSNGRPHRIRVSLGPETNRLAALWMALPEPPARPGRSPWSALVEARKTFAQLKFDPHKASERLRKVLDELRAQLTTEANDAHFDALVRMALDMNDDASAGRGAAPALDDAREDSSESRSPLEAARRWLKAFQEGQLCRCWPSIDVSKWRVHPRDPSPGDGGSQVELPGVEWQLHEMPRGEVVPGTSLRFSTDARRAKAVFSIGPPRPGGPVDLARQLMDAIKRAPAGLQTALMAPGREIESLSEHAETYQTALSAVEVPVCKLLDELLKCLEGSKDNRPHALSESGDEVLATLRAWSASAGLTILPAQWSFVSSPSSSDLPELTLTPRFHAGSKRGVVVLEQFGLSQNGAAAPWCECRAFLSAGPSPADYEGFRRRIQQRLKNEADTSRLLANLESWPKAALEKDLEYVAQQFFLDFWTLLGGQYSAAHPAEFRDLHSKLDELLSAGLELHPFYPRTFQDHPERWIKIVNSGSLVTGRVTRVVMPGLKDRKNNLRISAIVEVD